ncbi:hypothetical protein GQR36_14145 [Enterococcus termitis]
MGEIEESLKWHQPTYTTSQTKSGTPIRMDRFGEGKIAIFFIAKPRLSKNLERYFQQYSSFLKIEQLFWMMLSCR